MCSDIIKHEKPFMEIDRGRIELKERDGTCWRKKILIQDIIYRDRGEEERGEATEREWEKSFMM